MKMLWWVSIVSVLVAGFSNLSIYVEAFENFNKSLLHVQSQNESMARAHRQVNLTIITSAVAKGAVCLDGSPPAYYLDRGFGVGYNSWVIDLEGGAWCNDIKSCVSRKKNAHGSSKYMNKQKSFNGLLSSKPAENPDFYNWNKVRVNYCDGASFSGNSEDKAAKLQFRGQRIWSAVMEDLMSKGMRHADEALLTGCSAGGLASILHCDEFRALFNKTTKVKCLSDAGLFLDVEDVSGEHSVRDVFSGVIGLQDVKAPSTCHLDPLSCFFPQNLINNVTTPLFILNSAYDAYQIGHGLAPPSADPKGKWNRCKKNHKKCTASQIQAIQEFRSQMLKVVEKFSSSKKNGLFINSCFSHCQSELPNTWLADDSPVIGNKAIATAVGDWYFDRALVDAIGRPYPCDKTCQNII